jgi:hypothetical protein
MLITSISTNRVEAKMVRCLPFIEIHGVREREWMGENEPLAG